MRVHDFRPKALALDGPNGLHRRPDVGRVGDSGDRQQAVPGSIGRDALGQRRVSLRLHPHHPAHAAIMANQVQDSDVVIELHRLGVFADEHTLDRLLVTRIPTGDEQHSQPLSHAYLRSLVVSNAGRIASNSSTACS